MKPCLKKKLSNIIIADSFRNGSLITIKSKQIIEYRDKRHSNLLKKNFNVTFSC